MKSKKVLLAAAALVFSLGAFSQQTETVKTDTTVTKWDTTKKHTDLNQTSTTTLQDHQTTTTQATTKTDTAANNSAAASTTAASTTSTDISNIPKPNFGRYYIPALGSYNAVASSADNKSVKITGDENNPGKIWVEGLTEMKFYALLKSVPGTYKIPAQKQDNLAVAEGTLVYDENSKQVTMCSGCGFNDQAPTAVEPDPATEPAPEVSKKDKKHHKPVVEKVKKTPVITFTGTKAEQGTVSILQ